MFRRFALCLAIASLFVLSSAGSARAQDDLGALEKRADSLMAAYDGTDSPGAVVGVIRDGEVVFAEAYGMADVAHEVPMTTETRFNLASVSKQFTGFAFALLEQRGELSLDDPVGKYLPDWPTFDQTVTIRHLLTHTSGYREAFGPMFLVGRRLAPREEALEVVRRQPALEFPAGSKRQYSSSAYVILTEIAERVTGQTFPAWMEENVFGPLEMEGASVKASVGEVMPGAASSYADAARGGYREPSFDNAWYGSADVYAAVDDLAKWLGNFQTAELGGPAVQERMRQRFVLTSGDTTRYALGLYVDNVQGLRRLHHGGTKEGFRTWLTYYPELEAGVVVMANYAGIDARGVARRVSEAAFPEHLDSKEERPAAEEVPVDADLLERYAGAYQAEDGRVYVVEAGEGRLSLTPAVIDVPFPLVPRSKVLFGMAGQDIRLRFRPDAEGKVSEAILQQGGDSIPLQRARPWHPGAEELSAYAGRYVSPELEAVYTVTAEDSVLVAEHRWIGESRLEPLTEDVFGGGVSVSKSFPPFRLQLRFERDEDGAVSGYRVSIFRTRGVWFARRDENVSSRARPKTVSQTGP